MNEEKEIWLPVVGYEGLYEVSNWGRVKHLGKKWKCGNHQSTRISQAHIMNFHFHRNGYPTINMRKPHHKQMSVKTHRLVAEAFIPNPENKPQVNHINGVKTDNRSENLEWATNKENVIHSYKMGLQVAKSGGEQGQARLVLNTSTGVFYECIKEAADSISRIGKNNYGWLYKKLTGWEKNITDFILV